MPASKADDGTDEAASPSSSDPGSRLREAREAQGLSLEELGNELRIGAPALAALEENRFEALGATVFAKGYLKQYGTRLGLDVRELSDLYERAGGKPQVEIAPSRGIELRDERPVAHWMVRTILVGIGIAGGVWWWMQRPQTEPAVTAAGSDDIAAPAAGSAVAERAVEAPAGEEQDALAAVPEPPAAAPAPEDEAAPEFRETAPAEIADSAEGRDIGVAAAASAADPDPVPPADGEPLVVSNAAELPAADGPAIEVHFIEESWAEITDTDGSRLYYDLGRAGTRVRFPIDRNLTFYFGKGSAVELSIDGESVPVPGAERRDVVRFSLDELRN